MPNSQSSQAEPPLYQANHRIPVNITLIFALGIAVFGLVSLIGFWEGFFSVLIRIVIYGAIAYYLMTPEVKKAFGRA